MWGDLGIDSLCTSFAASSQFYSIPSYQPIPFNLPYTTLLTLGFIGGFVFDHQFLKKYMIDHVSIFNNSKDMEFV